jgi:hypothetical protein
MHYDVPYALWSSPTGLHAADVVCLSRRVAWRLGRCRSPAYTVRYEPFSVELILPNGSKHTRPLPRQPTHFFHRANFRWPVPDGPDQQLIQCEIRWVGFPAGDRLINSFGTDVQEQQFETTLGKLRKAVFAGGDFRTVRSPNGLTLVTRGTWPLADTAILNMADRIVQFHTAVWQDHGVPDHRVFLVVN